MDYFLTFLETHQAQWPLGQMRVLNQVHSIALGSPLAHPLRGSDLLRTANFIQLTISRPKSHKLPLPEVREFMKKIAAIAPDSGQLGLELEESETLQGAIAVRMLIAHLQG